MCVHVPVCSDSDVPPGVCSSRRSGSASDSTQQSANISCLFFRERERSLVAEFQPTHENKSRNVDINKNQDASCKNVQCQHLFCSAGCILHIFQSNSYSYGLKYA